MPGIGDVIDGAVQQAPQPLRHGKASGFIPHYKPGWANRVFAAKVGVIGEARMERANRNSKSLRHNDRRIGRGAVAVQDDRMTHSRHEWSGIRMYA
jgi:hypothetical protein